MLKEVQNRADVSHIVRTFYDKVRIEPDLGPIFNAVITDWEEHLEKLTDFWEVSLFGGKVYLGDPIAAHQTTDAKTGNVISAFHFGIWLNLWYETIDAFYTGENADLLKHRARKMHTFIMIAIHQGRTASQ